VAVIDTSHSRSVSDNHSVNKNPYDANQKNNKIRFDEDANNDGDHNIDISEVNLETEKDDPNVSSSASAGMLVTTNENAITA
jgi:hypothetical protein